jgi:hypothetical protein
MKDDADLFWAKPLPTRCGQRRHYGGKSEERDDRKDDDQQGVASHGDFMRNLDPGLVLITLALSCAACGESPTVLTAFRTEAQAQTHCPKDIVVWLDP